jgi:uncharacterized protein YprB with RNaseH-like and TPR domain
LDFSGGLCPALPVLVPDFRSALPPAEKLVFFDLETTGLSGGAGTAAFLAAFGRLVPAGGGGAFSLRIRQYLLLDYPGEPDFLRALSGEFSPGVFAVTYNGKSFDAQILRTRFLMNRMEPPEFAHADLLHPARLLWKRVLGECSQGALERRVLALDRGEDVPGAMAPDLWFAFLRTGDPEPLGGICEHNLRDIAGLAAILAAMNGIARSPVSALDGCAYDLERLALRWHGALRKRGGFARGSFAGAPGLAETGKRLLALAAERNLPAASLVYAREAMKQGNCGEGRGALRRAADSSFPRGIRLAALRSLALDSEWRLGEFRAALRLAEEALDLCGDGAPEREGFERRAARLRRKIEKSC